MSLWTKTRVIVHPIGAAPAGRQQFFNVAQQAVVRRTPNRIFHSPLFQRFIYIMVCFRPRRIRKELFLDLCPT